MSAADSAEIIALKEIIRKVTRERTQARNEKHIAIKAKKSAEQEVAELLRRYHGVDEQLELKEKALESLTEKYITMVDKKSDIIRRYRNKLNRAKANATMLDDRISKWKETVENLTKKNNTVIEERDAIAEKYKDAVKEIKDLKEEIGGYVELIEELYDTIEAHHKEE
ncbi:hypothetical protein F5Y00DRAFT_259880 [Daldinia vernicosa]|uniref:uncharacterized protein n=1 Tax=Daldinia vernicosa TaxID=114800 RepID=UPI0020073F21|nr:uncharacterized protein F5Y00DRAFT_259880 [Daldinia vernicosa]KAI0851345.1 hypothetical protein F5Y00DRAFT_259880 [Daldinia vernicosa]